MQKLFKSDFGIILLIAVLFSCLLPFFYLHQGLLAVDTGREYYLASQTAQGGVLYKDLFNIYGPFSYQFNALLFILFGEKITTLYHAGLVNSLVILVSLYLISREFLNKSLSFLVCILTMFSLVYNTFLYNTNITYSYGIVYALSSLLISVLFLIKFIKNENPKFLYISCLFAGLSILNKYEFVFYPFIYLTLGLKPKQFAKCVLWFLSFPVLSFSILFLQGLRLGDLISAFKIMTAMAGSESMKIFYSNFGNFFEPRNILPLILKNPIFAVFGFLPIINIILAVKNRKDRLLFIFSLCSIAACFKFTLFLNIEHMGAFLFPLCLLTTLVLLQGYNNLKYVLLVGLILLFANNDFTSLTDKNYLLKTQKGSIYTYRKDGEPIQKISDYLIKNSQPADKVVVLPEGAMINFVSDRKSDNTYHNLTPLYYSDTFGEQRVMNHFKNNPPEYFIILPLSTIEYGSENFCTYAQNFCEMIKKNYEEVEITIYKRKQQ